MLNHHSMNIHFLSNHLPLTFFFYLEMVCLVFLVFLLAGDDDDDDDDDDVDDDDDDDDDEGVGMTMMTTVRLMIKLEVVEGCSRHS